MTGLTLILIFCGSPTLAAAADEIPYGTGAWDSDIFGNHRAVIRVDAPADLVRVTIPWRRRDFHPDRKNLILVDAATGKRIVNMIRLNLTRESGELLFQPATVPGDYFVYYLPYVSAGSANYPRVTYPEPEKTVDPQWLRSLGITEESGSLPPSLQPAMARTVEFQSISEFHSFFPMEIIATRAETERLMAKHPDAPYMLFAEHRTRSIRLRQDLPQCWIGRDNAEPFFGEPAPGEFFVFQVGVWACRRDITIEAVRFSDLRRDGRTLVASGQARCFNLGGVNWDGRPFKKSVPVKKGEIQALWFGVQIPRDLTRGRLAGNVTVQAAGLPPQRVPIDLNVKGEVLADAGDSEPWRMSRLRWLDSTLAMDDEVTAPYQAIRVRGRELDLLGRDLTLEAGGLPRRIRSFFTSEMTGLGKQGRDLLAEPLRLVLEDGQGRVIPWRGTEPVVVGQKPAAVDWTSTLSQKDVRVDCLGRLEADGYLEYKLELKADKEFSVKDIRLEIVLPADVARYMMGLGQKGGKRPGRFEWKWEVRHNQDALWIGDVNAGLQCNLRAENYARPLNTNFYLSKPLQLPPSWYNEGRGGIRVTETAGQTVTVAAYSGARTLRPGEPLHFNFILLLTPFKPLDTAGQWNTRFFHAFKPPAEVKAAGANTINVHHANDANPYINYPFIHTRQMKEYIDQAHALGLKVKIYNTIRELSNRAPEIFALRSLGDEIFSRGPGGGFSWLQEHLGEDYIAAWFVPNLQDAAIINSGMSRWHNYYIEGLDWLTRNIAIDGLYIDDVAFDRTTMKRVRKVLDRRRPEALLDLHSANQFNPRDGFASSANLYLEHFPYLNRLWFGEYFDYDSQPDYWLVEISGIPFGLMGEMLEKGGNPWRGMVFGMTNRLPWSGENPSRFWKVWDDFGIQQSKMAGWWAATPPVRTGRPDVLVTAWVRKDRTLIALASWSGDKVDCRLSIDWEALGLDPAYCRLQATAVEGFQPAMVFKPDDPIPLEPGKGWLLVLAPVRR